MSEAANNTSWPGKRLGFAAGCFHFGLKDPTESQTVGDYARLVREALDSFPAVTNATVKLHEGESAEITPLEDVPTLEDGDPYPFPHFLTIQFDLSIPTRIQEGLQKATGAASTGTELFRIYIEHAYYSPVAIIVPVDSKEAPASCVPVVREFMRNEFNSRNNRVKFEALGPSPFHANFYIVGDAIEDRTLCATFVRRYGYADVNITADIDSYESLDEALNDVRATLIPELDIFYDIVKIDVRAMRVWRAFEEDVQPLLRKPEADGWFARIRRAYGRSASLSDAHADLLRFEYDTISASQHIARSVQRHYADAEIEYARPLVEDRAGNRPAHPVEQFAKLISFAEQRRSKSFELLVVLIASLVGGIVGAVLTRLLQASTP